MQDYDAAATLWPTLGEAYSFRAILHGQRKDHENAIDDSASAFLVKQLLVLEGALSLGADGLVYFVIELSSKGVEEHSISSDLPRRVLPLKLLTVF